MCQDVVVEERHRREPSEMQVTRLGLDLGERVFQVHGVDAAGRTVV